MEEGLQKILERIDSEAKEEEKRILGQASKEAGAILSQAEKEAEEEAAVIKKQYGEKAERTKGMVKASTRISAKMKRLKAENQAIETAFEQAKKELARFKKTKKYLVFLEREIADALSGGKKGAVQLVASRDDRKRFTSAFLKKLERKTRRKIKLSKETKDMLGGVIIIVPGEGVELNRSFEAKLADFRERKLSEIAKTLYPSGGKK